MAVNPVHVFERYTAAKTARATWETVWQEIFDYTMPGRSSLYERTPGQRRDDLIFDETAVVGVQEFSSRMVQGITPNNVRWARLQPAPAMKAMLGDSLEEVQVQLDQATETIFDVIEASNYQQEAHESFLDVAIGTGNMVIEDGDIMNPVKFHATPISEVYLEPGPFDKIDAQFREREPKGNDIKLIWPKSKLSVALQAQVKANPHKPVKLIEATMRDWSDLTVERYDHCVIEVSSKHVIYSTSWSGLGSSPWINFRWAKHPGECWGRGPLYNSLAAIKTANLTVQLILENAEMAIAGVWQADDDGVINPANVRLVPGTIIPRSTNSRGLEPLSTPGNFDVSQLVLTDMRHNINKALYNNTLGRREGTPTSATEVAERMAELSRQLGSTFGRLQSEFVQPVIQRVIYLMKKQGRIELPGLPNGRELKIVAASPLSRAQRNEDITQHINYATVLGQLFGPTAIQGVIDTDKFALQLAEWYEVSGGLLRTKEEQQQLAQEAGQAMAQSAAAGIDPVQGIKSLLP